ncbi:NAD-dependent epimerase/dehydratase family protein [Candidatus Parcubacteria bacterium]|nr:MAG: NAD-dependent epimerase/dehydratase family protein [Candidatus Parcubacteria bacterium]
MCPVPDDSIAIRSHGLLHDQATVDDFFNGEKQDYVFLAVAIVGGIHANNRWPADFIRDYL